MSNSLDSYVLLTGSVNNSGDYLIKYRGKDLLRSLRPDREFIDMDRTRRLTDEQLEVINQCKALILLGGPALQKDVYPNVYPLRESLQDIKVPIVTMGVGWKHKDGDWRSVQDDYFIPSSRQLLERLADNGGIASSVRDYRSLHILMRAGVENVIMTGCPALYVKECFDKPICFSKQPETIILSVGVSFVHSYKMEEQMKRVFSTVRGLYPKAKVYAAFHHAFQQKERQVPKSWEKKHQDFWTWCEDGGIVPVDVSGCAETMIDLYGSGDLHVGYRVHGHIMSCSASIPSVLIAEDGRGKGLYEVVGGVVFDGYRNVESSLEAKIKQRLISVDPYNVLEGLHKDVSIALQYESAHQSPRMSLVRNNINSHYNAMRRFILQLP
ncbi:polysaccharide pyruvyl transferase family protein [Desulfovibrio mangrovi]|uniref:polysaccharide pyruvyl transferase family protein n=1 Tax=Desulfovibrio mangrovi TaxID=2976983 RepID=UPI002245D2B3|nr:polysaccharide pyruvyl transferase family protein [Desulfovibrio mangrovi]UZP66665.1 polysaccharide pyruvyl transferase family protein [Desulfovibrio mangrovi]